MSLREKGRVLLIVLMTLVMSIAVFANDMGFETDLSDTLTTYIKNETAPSLTVKAAAVENATISYQWFKNTDQSTVDGIQLVGETEPTLNISTENIGITYYYAVATYTIEDVTTEIISKISGIEIKEIEPLKIKSDLEDAYHCNQNDELTLTVEGEITEGALSYQWYECTDKTYASGKIMDGQIDRLYQVSTENVGSSYYYVVLTHTLNEKVTHINSNITKVEIGVSVEEPIIINDLDQYSRSINEPLTLSVESEVKEGELTYQWYQSTDSTYESGVKIEDAITTDYSVQTDALGTTYYYVVVTNTLHDSSQSVKSRIAQVEVNQPVMAMSTPDVPFTITDDQGNSIVVQKSSVSSYNYEGDEISLDGGIYYATVDALPTFVTVGCTGKYGVSSIDYNANDIFDVNKIVLNSMHKYYLDDATVQTYFNNTLDDVIDRTGYFLYFEFNNSQSDMDDYCGDFGMVLHLGNRNNPIDKIPLENEIQSIQNDYYQSDDTWNGKSYNRNGFRSLANSTIQNAQNEMAKQQPNQLILNKYLIGLQNIKSNLIHKNQVNASALYKCHLDFTEGLKDKKKDDYTIGSWNRIQNNLNKAKMMLDGLYIGGQPTEINKITYQSTIDEMLTELKDSYKLDTYASSDNIFAANASYHSIELLANILFNPANMDVNQFVSEGYESYLRIRNTSLQWRKNNGTLADGSGNRTALMYKQEYAKLWASCYKELESEKDIRVTLSIVDNYAIRNNIEPLDCVGIYNFDLSQGHTTLQDALLEIADANDEITFNGNNSTIQVSRKGNRLHCNVGWYINGVYVFDPRFESGSTTVGSQQRDAIQLHDGDRIVLSIMEVPTIAEINGARDMSNGGAHRYIKYLTTDQSMNQVVEAGSVLTLSSKIHDAFPSDYTGNIYHSEGLKAYRSDVQTTQSDAKNASTQIDTGITTDEQGSFSIKFYAEGWYALNLIDESEKGGLLAGETILVQVTESTNKTAVLDVLKKELDTLYEKYEEKYYAASEWSSLNNHYQTGKDGIDAASTIKVARQVQLESLNAIQTLQKQVEESNVNNLAEFRLSIDRVPDDVSLIDQNIQLLIDKLIENYNSMSPYQKEQVTGQELEKYNGIIGVYKGGLSAPKSYDITIEIKADTIEAETIIGNMVAYLHSHGTYHELSDVFKLNQFQTLKRTYNPDANTYGDRWYFPTDGIEFNVIKAFPDDQISVVIDPDYYAYTLVKDADDDPTDKNTFISPDGQWRVSDEAFDLIVKKENNIDCFRPVGHFNYYIKDREYEIKDIIYSGISSSDIEKVDYTLTDDSNYKLDNKGSNEIRFDIKDQFIMPYQDVKIQLVWGPVDNYGISDAKRALKSHFETYEKSDYEAEQWIELVSRYNNGLDAISKGTSEQHVENAKSEAMTAMSNVPKIDKNTLPQVGNGQFDAKEKVGYVDLSIENHTFSGGDFTGNILSKNSYAIGQDDTMMTVVLRALAEEGYSWTGTGGSAIEGAYDIAYLSSIKKDGKTLGEFSGTPKSGWMGTLNYWFTNEGFQQFSVSNGKLKSGDTIRIQFTQSLGADLGGSWDNSDTSLNSLSVSSATLKPSFSKDKKEYFLVISGSQASIKVKPIATNKNYLTKIFLNEKVTTNAEGNSLYKMTESIPVKSGDTLYIGVGEPAWPSMNNQGEEARAYEATWYEIHVISASGGVEYINQLIGELIDAASVSYSNHVSVKSSIDYIEMAYGSLSVQQKSSVINYEKVKALKQRIEYFETIQRVKNLLNNIPVASKVTLSDTQKIVEADKAYKGLTLEQQMYITIGDVKNYNESIKKLIDLNAFSGSTPEVIEGNKEKPTVDVSIQSTVANGELKAVLNREKVKKIIDDIGTKAAERVVFELSSDKKITKSNLVLEKDSIDTLVDTGKDIVIKSSIGQIALSSETLSSIKSQADTDSISISMGKIENDELTVEQKKKVGDKPVFDLEIASGSKITSFGNTQIQVTLPYILKDGESKEKIYVWYVSLEGNLERMGCSYDSETKMVTFKTNHFSHYMIGEDSNMSYVDLEKQAWFYDCAMMMVQRNLFAGVAESEFAPHAQMTRGMFVTVLHKLKGKPDINHEINFSDVSKEDWFSDAVCWAVTNHIASGMSQLEFKADDNITREQVAVMLYKYAQCEKIELNNSDKIAEYSDLNDVSIWAREAMSWAVSNGIINGRSDGVLDPSGLATRSEVSSMMKQFLELIE